jgi:hypothetical protein
MNVRRLTNTDDWPLDVCIIGQEDGSMTSVLRTISLLVLWLLASGWPRSDGLAPVEPLHITHHFTSLCNVNTKT